MKSLIARYKKYSSGGSISEMQLATGIGQGAGMVGQLADALSPADQYGKKSLAGNLLGSAGSMAAAGSAFGPVGSAVGAGVGLITGFINNGKQKKMADAMRSQEKLNEYQTNTSAAAARIASDPSIIHGNLSTNYYAAGGQLPKSTKEVNATPLSSTAAEFNGPSHEQGGISLPQQQAEVEGEETVNADYVFSDRLGYAKLHKPIAKAIGKIEQKALSPERLNSLKLLKAKEQHLKLSQEYTKQRLGLN